MKKILLGFGTRPEAVKMYPLVNELKTMDTIQTVVCVTSQHRQMLGPVLEAFHVVPEYNFSVIAPVHRAEPYLERCVQSIV